MATITRNKASNDILRCNGYITDVSVENALVTELTPLDERAKRIMLRYYKKQKKDFIWTIWYDIID
ncbi:MAG: hypothetical protein JXB17_07895 [Bacteroidales bacterium]|nr:hypothetical protein [Bacteroidales bacterium]